MTIDFADARRKMVDCQLRTTDVTSEAVLDAMGSVARELFVPARRVDLAYIDEDIEIVPASPAAAAAARYLMQPSPFGRLVQAAAIRPGDSVLDIACGSGYSAVILSRLAATVTAVESHPALAASARQALADCGCGNVTVVEGPLQAGHPAGAPYQAILVEGAVDIVPQTLFDQLADGGRLVVVEGRGNAAVARIYVKENGRASGRRLFNAAVRPLPGFSAEPAFVF